MKNVLEYIQKIGNTQMQKKYFVKGKIFKLLQNGAYCNII